MANDLPEKTTGLLIASEVEVPAGKETPLVLSSSMNGSNGLCP